MKFSIIKERRLFFSNGDEKETKVLHDDMGPLQLTSGGSKHNNFYEVKLFKGN